MSTNGEGRIPFDRALDYANKERITNLLYPLFVHNIGALLYHPTNQAHLGISSTAASGLLDQSQEYIRNPQSIQPPALDYSNFMANAYRGNIPQPPHSIVPNTGSARPGLDRSHSLPTPPRSAESISLYTSGSSNEYAGYVPAQAAIWDKGSNGVASRQPHSAPSSHGGDPLHQSMSPYGGPTQSTTETKKETGRPTSYSTSTASRSDLSYIEESFSQQPTSPRKHLEAVPASPPTENCEYVYTSIPFHCSESID